MLPLLSYNFVETREAAIWDAFSNCISALDSEFFYLTIVLVGTLPHVFQIITSAHFKNKEVISCY